MASGACWLNMTGGAGDGERGREEDPCRPLKDPTSLLLLGRHFSLLH